jgi:hypothetical protein
MGSRVALLRVDDGSDTATGIDILRYLQKLHTFQGRDLVEALAGGVCNLQTNGPDQWLVSCGNIGFEIGVGRFCPESRCRWEALGFTQTFA